MAQARSGPKLVPLRRVIRMDAASRTGPIDRFGSTDRVQTARMPQKPSTKNSPSVTAPWKAAATTIAWRQSEARSAIRPSVRLSPIMIRTGTALMTPIPPELMPFSANHTPAWTTAAPSGIIVVK